MSIRPYSYPTLKGNLLIASANAEIENTHWTAIPTQIVRLTAEGLKNRTPTFSLRVAAVFLVSLVHLAVQPWLQVRVKIP
jgi:hypothetical protein